MKVKELSLLIIDEDKDMRQVLAAFVSERYRSVTAAAPEEVGSLIALESFDVMITPQNRHQLFRKGCWQFKGSGRRHVTSARFSDDNARQIWATVA